MSGIGRAPRARGAVLLLWSLLITALCAWPLSRSFSAGTIAILLFTVVPLLLPLPGLWQGRRRTYRWAALTLAPAMTWSLTEVVANPAARRPAACAALLAFCSLAALVAALRTTTATR
jgi:uncharacterized membrane protein